MQNDRGVDLQGSLVFLEGHALTHTGLAHRLVTNGRLTASYFCSESFEFLHAFVVALFRKLSPNPPDLLQTLGRTHNQSPFTREGAVASMSCARGRKSSQSSDTAAAGDRFIARLTAPLRDGRRLIAAKGAIIEGRLSDLEIEFHPAERVTFGLFRNRWKFTGSKVPLAAQLDLYAQVKKEDRKLKGLKFYLSAPGEHPHQFYLIWRHAILPKHSLPNG